MKPVLAIIIGATVGACAAEANGRVVYRSTYYPPVYQPVLAAQYVAPPYAVPYSVGLAQVTDPALVEKLDRIAAALEKLSLRSPNGEIADLPPEPEYVGIIRQNCASCHGITPKGNKLSFFDTAGRFKEMTPDLLGNVIAQVSSGAMPKGGKMEAADRLKLIAGLTTAPEQLKSPAKMPGAK